MGRERNPEIDDLQDAVENAVRLAKKYRYPFVQEVHPPIEQKEIIRDSRGRIQKTLERRDGVIIRQVVHRDQFGRIERVEETRERTDYDGRRRQ